MQCFPFLQHYPNDKGNSEKVLIWFGVVQGFHFGLAAQQTVHTTKYFIGFNFLCCYFLASPLLALLVLVVGDARHIIINKTLVIDLSCNSEKLKIDHVCSEPEGCREPTKTHLLYKYWL